MKRRLLILLVALLAVGYLGSLAIDRFIGNVTVRFYGRVVDVAGRPLPGVTVHAKLRSVMWLSVPMAPRFKQWDVTAVTNEDGRFSFRAGRANLLGLGPFQKEGWKPSVEHFRKSELGFEYPILGYEYPPPGRQRPDDPSNPIVYVMEPVEARP